ncbi:MAG: hypothetical protein FJY85_10845 [Deltaproteobacteria bacterium]|nr:hypothetical protein [Deltaproteobacteria bacterium]
MRKAAYFLMIASVSLGLAVLSSAQDKDCPDCPKGPTKASMLDPGWKEFAAPPLAPGQLPDCHRVQFGKQDCIECHQKETPVIYNQWLVSKHGINNVKCGVCHGDASNYRAFPDRVVCIGCHSHQVRNMPAQALVTNCSYCHKGHLRTVHNISKYERFAPGEERKRLTVPGF